MKLIWVVMNSLLQQKNKLAFSKNNQDHFDDESTHLKVSWRHITEDVQVIFLHK